MTETSNPESNASGPPDPLGGNHSAKSASSNGRRQNGNGSIHPGVSTAALGTPDAAGVDLIKIGLEALRGRLPLLIIAGIFCGAGLAAIGWKLGHQTYHSSGLVRIAFELPQVMTETDQNGPIQMFDTFMQSQRLLIGSRRVLDAALQDPIWRTTGRPLPTDPDDYFTRHVKVDINARSEFIQISVVDNDPGTTYAAANSIVAAYQQLYNLQEEQTEKNRIGVLDDKQKMTENEINQLSAEILAGAQEYGTANLDMFFENAVERVNLAQESLERVRTAMAMSPALAAAQVKPESRAPASAPVEMTIDQIAMVDSTMQTYQGKKAELEDELKGLLALNLGENHERVKAERQQIKTISERIDQYADSYRVMHPGGAESPTLLGAASPDSLIESEARLAKVVDREHKEMISIGNKRLKLQQMQDQLGAKQAENAELLRRINTLRAEHSLGGRLSVTSTPEIPTSPDTDQRFRYAVAGGVAGMGFPVMVVLALALIRPATLRFADQASGTLNQSIPLLGILPTILDESASPDERSDAAHNVHQVRVTLRSMTPPERTSSIYLVTSSNAGEGKTSLVMALGLSLAAAGHRTLVMDCDMMGRHLTSKLQMRGMRGLKESLVEGSMRKSIRTVHNNLYVLPVGQINRGDASSLSPQRLDPLLSVARQHFDTILIDSGPVLGSVEAAVLAQEADGVVFVIGRDQQSQLVERAVERLTKLGARVQGFVFNRARRSDYQHSMYGTSSFRSAPEPGAARIPLPEPDGTAFAAFGPLVTSMLGEMPGDAPRPNGLPSPNQFVN